MKRIDARYESLLKACLGFIESEMSRLYWNKYQKSMDSPFINTGEHYQNEVFSAKAYDWNDNSDPNFEYKGLKLWWYKHYCRGLTGTIEGALTAEFLADMLNTCIRALRKDFGEIPDVEGADD